jgi:hypothetical protein
MRAIGRRHGLGAEFILLFIHPAMDVHITSRPAIDSELCGAAGTSKPDKANMK